MKKTVFFIALCLLSTEAYSQVGINTENPKGIFHIDPKKNNPISGTVGATEQKDDFVVSPNGNVIIGSNSGSIYSKLDIQSNNQGILIPRVNLTSNTLDLNSDGDNNVSNQPVGLFVFNNGTTLPKGFYFWNGTQWSTIDNNKPTISPAISDLSCSSGQISPPSFVLNTAYSGILSVPYVKGNGGSYSGGTSFNSNGLTFTLNAGTLNNGDGMVTYSVSGTPTFASPSTAAIPISFLGSNCSVTIGDNSSAFALNQIKSTKIVIPAEEFENFRAAGPANIMTGKASADRSTVTNRTQAYKIASDEEKAKFIIINGLRMDFIQSPTTNTGVSPKFFRYC